MLTQNQQAVAWGQHCYTGPFLTVPLFGNGHASIRPAIAEAASALSACLKVWDYATEAADTGGFCCRAKTGNPNSTSNHGRGIAIDINWKANPYGAHLVTNMPLAMVQAICGIRTNSGDQVWQWGGNWSGNKDAMHFEIVCTPGALQSGINQRTIPTTRTGQTPTGFGGSSDAQLLAFYAAIQKAQNEQLAAKYLQTWAHLSTGWPVGTAPNPIEAAMVQQALDLIVPDSHVVVDGNWGPDSTAALFKFQAAWNAFRPDAKIADGQPGEFTNQTKFLIGARLTDIAAGKA